jgi:hypothetical protein
LAVPASAYLDYSGNDWTCDEGLHKRGKACKPD